MNKFFRISSVLAIAGIAMFPGCKEDAPEVVTGEIPVNLTADIAVKPKSSLKVANDQWETGDLVGLFMKHARQALTASGAVYSNAINVQMSIDGDVLVPSTPVNYPSTGNVDFIAYYPYTTSVGSGYTVDVDVAGQAAGLPAEVLFSDNAQNKAPTTVAVTLNFLYSLAKIEITIVGGENSPFTSDDFAGMTANIEGMYTQAKLQLADGTFTGRQAQQSISMCRKAGLPSTFEALVLPTMADDDIIFLFNVGGKTYRYKPAAVFASHSLYRFNLALDFTLPTAVLLNATIDPRDEPQTVTGSISTHYFEPEMVFVQGGTFMMGSPEGTPDSRDDERPVREVTLSSYSIGKYQITQAQWEAVMGNNPVPEYGGIGENIPVEYVSWNGFVGTSGASMIINGITYRESGFIYRLNQLTGKQYRLPTEAEWEYAARGGSKSQGFIYSGSNTVGDVAWYYGNNSQKLKPVGTKSPNELGIYDMSGNGMEYCSDWYGTYPSEAETNPLGPSSGTVRVRRSGGTNSNIPFMRVASRSSIGTNYLAGGARLVLQ